MKSRNRLTLIVLLGLSSGYFMYSFAARIVLRAVPATIGSQSPVLPGIEPDIETVDESSRIAARFLPDQPWAKDATLQFRDGGQLFYYAQDWSQTNEKHSVEFEPLALVWFREQSQEPLVILAESAVVTFQRDVDLSSPDPGRIVAGELRGEVAIRGPEGLQVKGHHFIFSEEAGSIFSDNPVEFAWQKHAGHSEQGIQIDLEMASAGENGQLAVSTVRQVHLFRNVEMDFLFEQDNEVIPLSVRCAGRFMLKLLGHNDNPAARCIASFEDRVVVKRATELNTADVLKCDQLDLHLEEGTPVADNVAHGVASAPDSLPHAGDSRIQFRRMRAIGYVVEMTSELNEFKAVIRSPGEKPRAPAVVDYDAFERRLVLNDFDPKLSSQWKPRVHITQKTAELNCQQVELNHQPDGRVSDIICRGGGWLAYREPGVDGGPPVDVLLADWKRQLRRFTDNTTGHDVIDLYGDAVVRLPQDQSGVSADYIKVWIDPLNASGSDSPLLSRKSGDTDRSAPTPAPRRVLAQKDVLLVSPQMQGEMEELQVWFEDASPDEETPSELEAPAEARPLRPVSYRVDEAAGPLPLPDTPEEDKRQKEPVYVNAALTRVRIIRHGGDADPEVREVWTEGDVRITHHREATDGPMVLTGDRLHIVNKGENAQTMHLLGQPAQILDPRMKLIGEEIFFDRQRNLAWSDGSGELQLPAERDFDGKPLEEPTELTINWHEQMAFDGRVATFIGRVHASLFESVMRCQQMEVTMQKPLAFNEGAEPAERPEIATVTCQFDVEFNSHLIENGSLQEVRRAQFARFHLNHQTGKVLADSGPGTVSSWRRGRGKRAGLAPIAAAGANRAMDTQGTEWEFSQIRFAQDMTGSVNDRTTTFRGQVEVVSGPVDEPLEPINVDRMPKDGGAMTCGWLEFVQRTSTDGSKHVELLAKENARLEGRSFFGQADEISYDESKGLYMLRSSGDESILWREKVPGGERTAVVAETFRFIPSRNFVDFDKATRVQGLQ